ncbi:MAG: hypothetical protein AAF989_03260 [Planctomycetota bacterium]
MMQRILAIVSLALASCTAAQHPEVELVERTGLTRVISIDAGNAVIRVPDNWSITARNLESLQSDFDTLDPLIREQWNPNLFKGHALRIERLTDYSRKRSPRSELTLQIHEEQNAKTFAAEMRNRFADLDGMDVMIFPRLKSKQINGRQFHYFRMAYEQVVDEHLFASVGSDVYHFIASESVPYALPSVEISSLIRRIQLKPEDEEGEP